MTEFQKIEKKVDELTELLKSNKEQEETLTKERQEKISEVKKSLEEKIQKIDEQYKSKIDSIKIKNQKNSSSAIKMLGELSVMKHKQQITQEEHQLLENKIFSLQQ